MNEPDSAFQYSDAGFCVIQQLLEDVSGKPFQMLMKEIIFDPLSMNNSVYKDEFSVGDTSLACGHHKDGNVVEEKL